MSKVLGAWYKTEEIIFSMLGNDLQRDVWDLIDKVEFQIKNPKGVMVGVRPGQVSHRTSKALSERQKADGAIRETVVVVSVPKGEKDKYQKEIFKRLTKYGFKVEPLSQWRQPETH
jgi:hypothetical protein